MFKTEQTTTPKTENFYTEILNVLYDGSTLKRSRLVHDTLTNYSLVNETNRYKDKIGFALTTLAYTGLVNNVEPGYWRITESGKQVVKDNHPEQLIEHLKEEEQKRKNGEPSDHSNDLGSVSYITSKVSNLAKRMFPL